MAEGAWREDVYDPIWEWSGNHTPPIASFCPSIAAAICEVFNGCGLDPFVSSTHFWKVDNGDNLASDLEGTVEPCLNNHFLLTVENAYQKFLRYVNGGWTLKYYWQRGSCGTSDFHKASGGIITITHNGIGFRYNSLADLYKTGRATIVGFYECGTFPPRWISEGIRPDLVPTDIIIAQSLRDDLVWEILGRMIHLLTDMSFPAHTRNDIHGSNDPGIRHDSYEEWYGYQFQTWNAQTVYSQSGGPFIPYDYQDPLHFLMYTTAQLASYFGSNGPYNGEGNSIIGGNPRSDEMTYLQSIFPTLLTHIDGYDIRAMRGDNQFTENMKAYIRDKTLPHTVRATAGLLYWFAMEADLLANTLVRNSFGGGTLRINGATRSSGYRAPAWGSPSPITLEAIDQLYNCCNYRFSRWRKLVSGNQVGSWSSRTITITPEANTTYEAVFETLQPTATMSWQSPWLTHLYWNQGGDFTITLNPANPCAVYGWELQSRQLLNGSLQWGSAHEVTGVYFGGLGNVATLRNVNFQFYNNGAGADSLLRVRCRITVCGRQWYSYGGIFTFKPRNRPAGGGGPGGGCPFVYSWNGEAWVVDNNLLPQSADPGNEGRDVTDFYQLFYKPSVENDRYRLAIAEYEKEHSFLDQVKLLVVDHHPHASITVDDSGTVIQFLKPAAFIDAQLDSQQVLEQLYQLDNVKVEVTEDDTMRLWFDNGGGQHERGLLVIGQTERKGGDPPVRIVPKNRSGQQRVTFTSFRLRRNPSYAWALVGVSDTSVQEIEIEWKKDGEVDYAELSRKVELPFVMQQAELLNAVHYARGDVTEQLRMWDENYAELMPEEWIALEFSVPPLQPGMERSFILVSRGRYEALEGLKVAKGNIEATPTSTTQTQENLPEQFTIAQNYPNPFNPSTTIKFGLPKQQRVRLVVYDFLGRTIRTLRDEEMPAGDHVVIWDGKDEHGLSVASGLYFYRLNAGPFVETRKMVLLQ